MSHHARQNLVSSWAAATPGGVLDCKSRYTLHVQRRGKQPFTPFSTSKYMHHHDINTLLSRVLGVLLDSTKTSDLCSDEVRIIEATRYGYNVKKLQTPRRQSPFSCTHAVQQQHSSIGYGTREDLASDGACKLPATSRSSFSMRFLLCGPAHNPEAGQITAMATSHLVRHRLHPLTSALSAAQMIVQTACSMSGGTSFLDATRRMRAAISSQWSSKMSYASIVKSSRMTFRGKRRKATGSNRRRKQEAGPGRANA